MTVLIGLYDHRSDTIVPFPKMSGYKLKKMSRKSKMKTLVRSVNRRIR